MVPGTNFDFLLNSAAIFTKRRIAGRGYTVERGRYRGKPGTRREGCGGQFQRRFGLYVGVCVTGIEQCPCQSKKVAATVLAVLLALVSCGDPTSGGPWVVTTAPTATQSGVETRTCTLDSSHKETRTVPATGGGGNFSASGTYTRQNVSGYSVSFYNVANLNYGNCLFSWRGQTY